MSTDSPSSNATKLQHEEPAHVRRAADDLASSGLTLSDAKQHGLYPLNPRETRLHSTEGMNSSSLMIHYAGLDGKPLHFTNSAGESSGFYRLRMYPDDPDVFPQRYWQPKLSGCAVFLPLGVDWAKVLKDTSLPIYITEGEKKAVKATIERFVCAAVGGVDNFVKLGELLPELVKLAKGGRPMYIVYDGDDIWTEGVRNAMAKLARMLAEAGANVGIIHLPAGSKLDDYLVAHGAEAFAALPIRAWDIRLSLAAIREGSLKPRIKKQQVSNLVRGHMIENGDFYRTDGESLYYFSQAESALHNLDDIKGSALRAYLNDVYGLNASETEYSFVMEDILSHVLRHGTLTSVHLYAHWSASSRTLYLSAGGHQLFRITDKGWERVPNGTDDVLMTSTSGEVTPVADTPPKHDVIAEIFRIPNYAEGVDVKKAVLAWKVFLLTLMFPEANPTKVIPLCSGVKGSRKTSGARALLKMLHGMDADVFSFEDGGVNDLWAVLDKYVLIVLDNVDGKIKGLENVLAMVATGGMRPKRKLFTTNEEVLIRIEAGAVATSREPKSFSRGDVIDRLMPLPCERSEGFRPEHAIQAELAEWRPLWWAQVLELLVGVVAELGKGLSGGEYKWRMADFADFATTCGPALGVEAAEVEGMLDWQELERLRFAADNGQLVPLLRDAWETLEPTMSVGADPVWLGGNALYTLLESTCAGKMAFANGRSLGVALKEDWETVRELCPFMERKYDKNAKAWRFCFRKEP